MTKKSCNTMTVNERTDVPPRCALIILKYAKSRPRDHAELETLAVRGTVNYMTQPAHRISASIATARRRRAESAAAVAPQLRHVRLLLSRRNPLSRHAFLGKWGRRASSAERSRRRDPAIDARR